MKRWNSIGGGGMGCDYYYMEFLTMMTMMTMVMMIVLINDMIIDVQLVLRNWEIKEGGGLRGEWLIDWTDDDDGVLENW